MFRGTHNSSNQNFCPNFANFFAEIWQKNRPNLTKNPSLMSYAYRPCKKTFSVLRTHKKRNFGGSFKEAPACKCNILVDSKLLRRCKFRCKRVKFFFINCSSWPLLGLRFCALLQPLTYLFVFYDKPFFSFN